MGSQLCFNALSALKNLEFQLILQDFKKRLFSKIIKTYI